MEGMGWKGDGVGWGEMGWDSGDGIGRGYRTHKNWPKEPEEHRQTGEARK